MLQLLTDKKPRALPWQIHARNPRAGLHIDERLLHLPLPPGQLRGTDARACQAFDFIDTGLHQIIAGDLAPIDQLQSEGLFGGQRTCRAPQPGVVDVEAEHTEIAGADDLRAGHRVLPIGPGRRE